MAKTTDGAVRHGEERRIWLLVALTCLVAAAVQVWMVNPLAGPQDGLTIPWWALTVGFLVAEICVVHVRFGREAHSFALGEIPLVIGLFLADPSDLVSARLAAGVVVLMVRRQRTVKLLFNLSQWWLGTVAAVVIWRGLGGTPGETELPDWFAAVVAVAMCELLATAAIVLAVRLREGRLPVSFLGPGLFTGQLVSLTNVCVALVTLDILAQDWRGTWAMLVLGASVLFANRAYVGLQRRHLLLERLNEFTRDMGADLRLDTTAGGILVKVRELLDAENATLRLDAGFAGTAVIFRCDTDGIRTPGDGWSPVSPATTGSLTTDLRSEGRTVGSLEVADRLGDVGAFGADDQRLLVAMASHASVSLRNARLADLLRDKARESEHQALHDPLTGLPNRMHFARSVEDACSRGPAAVLLLDLDRFREVNDTLGHKTGDHLLREVATRLASIGETDCVARLGGDEFAVLLHGSGAAEAHVHAAKISSLLLAPLALSAISFRMEASIGIALSPDHGTDAQSLLRRADVAMYVAKGNRTGAEIYAADSDVNSENRLALVSEMRTALAANEFRLHYQPKANLHDGRVLSVEALIRWMHPVRGLLGPDEFIPVAEHVGLIRDITTWVMTTALAQCRRWQDTGINLSVAVNVAPASLHDAEFPTSVSQLLEAAGVRPRSLTLEITEGAIMRDPDHALRVLSELRALGVRLSIDDLGVGQSSLTYLRRLPVDEVKIDKSFVAGMLTVADDDAIVSALVSLVHNLRLSVVAEGVETEAIWSRLTEIGCDTAQGYWLSRPVEAASLVPWLSEWNERRAVVGVGAVSYRHP